MSFFKFKCQRCGKIKRRTKEDFLLGDFGGDLGGDFGVDFGRSKRILEALDKIISLEIHVCETCKNDIARALGLRSVRDSVKTSGKARM